MIFRAPYAKRPVALFAAALGALLLGVSGRAAAGEAKFASIDVDGRQRTFATYAPARVDAGRKLPLVLVLHGGAGDAERTQKLTRHRFNELADRDQFLVVYPEGVDRSWNDGRGAEAIPAQRSPVDDVKFIAALIDFLIRRDNVDPQRVYATGISNGAMMANRLACELSDKIAAIAPVAGQLPANLEPTCRPAKPVSVLTINGDRDPLVPFDGGEIRLTRFGRARGKVLSTAATMKFWAERAGCATTPTVATDPPRVAGDETRVRREVFPGCRNDAEVMLYVIEGGGHAWPGGAQYLPERLVGRASRQLDAADVIWDFFRRHARN